MSVCLSQRGRTEGGGKLWCGEFGLKNLKVASGLVCCVSVCGSLGLPHHVAPWEHQHWNGEAVKQQVRCLLFLFSSSLSFTCGVQKSLVCISTEVQVF